MLYFNNQFCSSLWSSDNLNGEMSRSDVDDTYGDLGGSGTGVHGVCTEIYRGWGHQRLTSSSVWQLLIGSIYKKKTLTHQKPFFFFYELLLIKRVFSILIGRICWGKKHKNTDTLKTLILKDIQIHYLYTCTYLTQMEFNMVKVIHIDHNPECLLSWNRNFKVDLCITIFSHKENILICPGWGLLSSVCERILRK